MEAVTQSGARARRTPKKRARTKSRTSTHVPARSRRGQTKRAQRYDGLRTPRPDATTGAWDGDPGQGERRDSRANHGDSRAEAPRTFAACFAKERCTEHRQEGPRRESAKTDTQSRERRADEQRARTGATLRHRPRTFTCKSRRTANGGAAHVCDVICDEWRRPPQGASRRDPREGRSRVPVDEWRHPFGRDKSKPHEVPAKCSPCGRLLTREPNEQELG